MTITYPRQMDGEPQSGTGKGFESSGCDETWFGCDTGGQSPPKLGGDYETLAPLMRLCLGQV